MPRFDISVRSHGHELKAFKVCFQYFSWWAMIRIVLAIDLSTNDSYSSSGNPGKSMLQNDTST